MNDFIKWINNNLKLKLIPSYERGLYASYPLKTITSTELYKIYINYCRQTGLEALPLRIFNREFPIKRYNLTTPEGLQKGLNYIEVSAADELTLLKAEIEELKGKLNAIYNILEDKPKGNF